MRSGQATSSTPAALAVSALLVVSLAACGSTSSTAIEPSAGGGATRASAPGSPAAGETTSAPITPADTGPARTASGAYVDWSTYAADPARFAQGEVVLFFHADWCPKCRETDSNLTADPASLPDGLTVVKLGRKTSITARKHGSLPSNRLSVQTGN